MALPASNGRDPLSVSRERMLALLGRQGISERVIQAFGEVPRERFVPPHLRAYAYDDRALPIGDGQTISQPLVVAMMIDALELKSDDRLLEVGAGSGYAAAVASRLARTVVGVERLESLRRKAEETITELQYHNVALHHAGDVLGRPEEAPFDAILVSAAAPHVPRTLINQLTEAGRIVLPVGGTRAQELVRVRKTLHGLELTRLGPCAFVPLIGGEAWPG